VYTFNAAPGQQVYFRIAEHGNDMAQISWKLTDADETELFAMCLGCGETGVHTLRKGGPYTLVVGSPRVPAVGAYRMQLFDVPRPQRFSVRVGDTVHEKFPGPGAGEIESPGAQDIYTFTAAAGERVHFRILDHARDMAQIVWRLTGPDEEVIFERCLGCSVPGTHTLRKGGTYTVTVGSRRVPATGVYRFQLSSAGNG
jgi:hypothetical protein